MFVQQAQVPVVRTQGEGKKGHVALRAQHHELTSWFGTASWVLVGLLMLAFAGYIVRLTALVRRTVQECEPPRNG